MPNFHWWKTPKGPQPHEQVYSTRRADAVLFMLCKNDQLWDAARSVREIEDRFNHVYHYPYVFLNEVSFTSEFRYVISMIASSKVEFGVIPRDHWYQPEWIDEAKATLSRHAMVSEDVIYGGSVSYRNMCRFNSGFFFRHPLMQRYKWYWRIEPGVHFHCDIQFDPFLFMQDNNKTYAFTISMVEFERTIPTLWNHIRDFVGLHPEYIAEGNALEFISDDGGESYNLCHFWSNFEIANMEFWRGEAYASFFDYLESKGGFYYEVYDRSSSSFTSQFTVMTHRDGVTPPFIQLLPRCFLRAIKYNFLTKSVMNMRPLRTAQNMTIGRRADAPAIHSTTSVRHFKRVVRARKMLTILELHQISMASHVSTNFYV
ncbi:hypothetical protein CVT26_005599 [Gymnopilus dilepis]|uniref:Glycosyltransferase family 15 protein n=1 Tax=Gymnopilus dilepis TaxID=231916 RepID=A0A409XZL8_9AGAR|nr:hypothetical protein CVT26_005599 [Gymnopilus dilepis]